MPQTRRKKRVSSATRSGRDGRHRRRHQLIKGTCACVRYPPCRDIGAAGGVQSVWTSRPVAAFTILTRQLEHQGQRVGQRDTNLTVNDRYRPMLLKDERGPGMGDRRKPRESFVQRDAAFSRCTIGTSDPSGEYPKFSQVQ